jgi:hypothetical protein
VWTALDLTAKVARIVRCVHKQGAAASCGRPFLASTCVDEANIGLATVIASLEGDKESWQGGLYTL